MGREWKPGDVALVDYGRGVEVMMRDHYGWTSAWAEITDSENVVESVRPLVVIDPEDREQVSRLGDAFCKARWDHTPGSNECDPLTFSSMQAALREFAVPTPPRPDEPTGLGAVVEDENGARHVRTFAGAHRAWLGHIRDDGGERTRTYAEIAAVRVLSDGVAS